MRLDRWGKIALLVSVIALLGAIVMPGALAQTPFVKTPHRVGPEPCLTCAE